MLSELRALRDAGYPQEFLVGIAKYRKDYASLSLEEREMQDFGYFLRMRYIEFLSERLKRR